MENIIKGWVLSLIGLIGAIGILLHWTGYLALPNPKALDTNTECIIGLLVSGAFFALPKTKLDQWITDGVQSIFDKFTGKKKDA